MNDITSETNIKKPTSVYLKIIFIIILLLIIFSILIFVIVRKNNDKTNDNNPISESSTSSSSLTSVTSSSMDIQSNSSSATLINNPNYKCLNPIFLNNDKTIYVCKVIILKEEIANYKICQDKRNSSPTNDKLYDQSVIPEVYNVYSNYLTTPFVINATSFQVNNSLCMVTNTTLLKDYHVISDKLIFYSTFSGSFGAPTDGVSNGFLLDLQNNQINPYEGGALNFDFALIDNNIVIIPASLGPPDSPNLLQISGYDLNSHKLLQSVKITPDTSKVPNSFRQKHPNQPLIDFYENKKAQLVSLIKVDKLKYALNYKIVNDEAVHTGVESDPNYIENDTYNYNLN